MILSSEDKADTDLDQLARHCMAEIDQHMQMEKKKKKTVLMDPLYLCKSFTTFKHFPFDDQYTD